MSSMMGSLASSADALRAFQKALNVVQNNITNVNTPGFAKQRVSLEARSFRPELGSPGGVEAGRVVSYRSQYAEQTVRRELTAYGRNKQLAEDLAQMEPIFSISGESGPPAALNALVEAFSMLAVSPNNPSQRQVVIDRAAELGRAFNQVAGALHQSADAAAAEVRTGVATVNRLTATLRELNAERRQNFHAANDPGLDARLNAALEELAEVVDFTALMQPDGTVSVYLGGEDALVIGDHSNELRVDFSTGPAVIVDAGNRDVTAKVDSGRLSSLLEMNNDRLASYLDQVNRLAAGVANRVNSLLAEGIDMNGSAPPVDLFSYDGAAAAATLAVTGITPTGLAAALPGAAGGNGNALRLADLFASKEIDGFTFTEYYGNLAGSLGRELAGAREDAAAQSGLLAQARTLREEMSGVSLDEEATHLIELQRAYEATAKVVSVLDDLTATAIGLIR